MTPPEPCQSEWPALLPDTMVPYGLELLQRVTSGSVALKQSGSDLMSTASVITEAHAPGVWSAIRNRVGVLGLFCYWSHIGLGSLRCHRGHGNVKAQAASTSHVWVHDPAAVGVCADLCCPRYHRDHSVETKGQFEPALPFTGPHWLLPPKSWAGPLQEGLAPYSGKIASSLISPEPSFMA